MGGVCLQSNYQVIIVAVVILIESFRRYSQYLVVLTYLTLHEINMLLLLFIIIIIIITLRFKKPSERLVNFPSSLAIIPLPLLYTTVAFTSQGVETEKRLTDNL